MVINIPFLKSCVNPEADRDETAIGNSVKKQNNRQQMAALSVLLQIVERTKVMHMSISGE